MTGNQFANYLENLKVRRKIDKIVFHHTSSPVESWQNSGSMIHYWQLYTSRGWQAGPHLFIAPSGIWLFSPIDKDGRGAPGDGNKNSIHIEIVGRYFDCAPTDQRICFNLALTTYLLIKKFKLKYNNLHNHFEYDPYAHETKFITGPWVEMLINIYRNRIEKLIEDNYNFDAAWQLNHKIDKNFIKSFIKNYL